MFRDTTRYVITSAHLAADCPVSTYGHMIYNDRLLEDELE